jgi:hypothetical protein
MTRSVDWSKPLSDEDREWALNRGMDLQIRENDALSGRTSDDTNDMSSVVLTGIAGTEPSLDSDRTEPSGVGEAQLALNAIQNSLQGSGEPDDDYSTMTKDELREEIEARNEERGEDDQLLVSGTKADLAERLREDDKS